MTKVFCDFGKTRIGILGRKGKVDLCIVNIGFDAARLDSVR